MSIQPRMVLCPQNKWNIKCPYTMTAEAITVHNTANDAPAINEINYMNSNNNEVSYHFAIDDVEVVQGLPIDRNGWHAGDGGSGYGNRKTIGIEICYSKSGGTRFDNAEKLAAKFIAQLLKERNWGMDKVKKHQDWSGKYCPHRTLDYGWDRFKNMVKVELDKLSAPAVTWVPIEKKTYVTITNTALYDVVTGNVVRNYGTDVTMEFVEQASVNGMLYYRTEYSKTNNVNNGVPANDVVEFTVQENNLKWTLLPEKISKVALRDCVLIDLKTGEVKKTFTLGEQIDNIIDYTEMGGETYYRTEYSRTAKKAYGIASYQLGEVTPAVENPEDFEGDTDVDLEPVSPTPDDGSKEDSVNVIIGLLNSVIEMIKNLFKKG